MVSELSNSCGSGSDYYEFDELTESPMLIKKKRKSLKKRLSKKKRQTRRQTTRETTSSERSGVISSMPNTAIANMSFEMGVDSGSDDSSVVMSPSRRSLQRRSSERRSSERPASSLRRSPQRSGATIGDENRNANGSMQTSVVSKRSSPDSKHKTPSKTMSRVSLKSNSVSSKRQSVSKHKSPSTTLSGGNSLRNITPESTYSTLRSIKCTTKNTPSSNRSKQGRPYHRLLRADSDIYYGGAHQPTTSTVGSSPQARQAILDRVQESLLSLRASTASTRGSPLHPVVSALRKSASPSTAIILRQSLSQVFFFVMASDDHLSLSPSVRSVVPLSPPLSICLRRAYLCSYISFAIYFAGIQLVSTARGLCSMSGYLMRFDTTVWSPQPLSVCTCCFFILCVRKLRPVEVWSHHALHWVCLAVFCAMLRSGSVASSCVCFMRCCSRLFCMCFQEVDGIGANGRSRAHTVEAAVSPAHSGVKKQPARMSRVDSPRSDIVRAHTCHAGDLESPGRSQSRSKMLMDFVVRALFFLWFVSHPRPPFSFRLGKKPHFVFPNGFFS